MKTAFQHASELLKPIALTLPYYLIKKQIDKTLDELLVIEVKELAEHRKNPIQNLDYAPIFRKQRNKYLDVRKIFNQESEFYKLKRKGFDFKFYELYPDLSLWYKKNVLI